jgi:hypothetical protein
MEDQEQSGFKGIDRLLGRLTVPAGKQTRSMSHAEARAVAFLPGMDAGEQKRFSRKFHHQKIQNFSYTSMQWNTGTHFDI